MAAVRITCLVAGLGYFLAGAPVVGAFEPGTTAQQHTDEPADPAGEPDIKAIDALLGRYVAVMEARDVAGLKALWPVLSEAQEQKIRLSFRLTRSIRVQLKVMGFIFEGPSAVVSCLRRDQIVTMEGRTFQRDGKATIRLLKKADVWTIESIN
jgi:hypothetical protein